MEKISFQDFQKLDLRIGRIEKAERVKGADKLLRLEIDLGDEQRQMIAGIAQHYDPEDLAGKQVVVLTNLEPKMLKGIESQGMVLAASGDDGIVLLTADRNVQEGTKVS